MATPIAGLELVPAGQRGAEIKLAGASVRERRLSAGLAVNGRYDRVLIDCPPRWAS